ncbi:TIR domain-containing protein [Morganella morganii]|nr:TIR domain-containing protein [Morganella morganii]
MDIIKPPLAVHFIWHSDDYQKHYSNISEFRRYLTRDIDRPFSRELNVPTFMYSSRSSKTLPKQLKRLATKDLVFLFLSENTLIDDVWGTYINNIGKEFYLIPVALDREALSHSNDARLKNVNFIRSFDWPLDNYQEYFTLILSHEIYRFGFNSINEGDKGTDTSLKLFLSHAKQDDCGVNLAVDIKDFIDKTNIQNFFDATDISPGYSFDEEIIKHLEESTVIAIGSDKYSSRYWCQREILMAKEASRPIVFVDTLEFYEDRIFPAAVNIPNIHISHDKELKDKEILRILISSFLETIRFYHAKDLLDYYKEQEWINKKSQIFARPPEIFQITKLLQEREVNSKEFEVLYICYPEPPVYPEEISWINNFEVNVNGKVKNKIEVVTPLWSVFEEQHNLKKIGISISDYKNDQFESHNQDIDELQRLSQVLASHLLSREHTLIYGGDLRENGFTQFILDEAMIVQNRLKDKTIRVENHLAWPLYLSDNVKKFKIKYRGVLKTEEHNIPIDIKPNSNVFLLPNSPENKYIWSRCLTEMRLKSIDKSDVRILAGGKCEGYLGKMPGVLEEFIIAIKKNKPIYLLGGFGGISQEITQSILNKSIKHKLTEKWQIENNAEYANLQRIAEQEGFSTVYDEMGELILNIDISEQAKKTGLTIDQYQRLMITPFVDEAVHLILRGLLSL